MKTTSPSAVSYNNYLTKKWEDYELMDNFGIQQIFKDFQKIAQFDNNLSPTFLLIDYTKRKNLHCSIGIKRLLGYDAKEVLDGGPDFLNQLCQKEYFKVFNEDIFPKNLAFLTLEPQIGHRNITFCHNTRLKNKEGDWNNLLLKTNYITSTNNLPIFGLIMFINIDGFKTNNVINYTVERVNKITGLTSVIDKEYYYPFEQDKLLTKQEKNILMFMADGLSSKMLADKLCISENTVSNHRQNIIRKTNTNNVAQLIAFAVRNGII
jgi:DNA-binding CsgD family transcriptional regulator